MQILQPAIFKRESNNQWKIKEKNYKDQQHLRTSIHPPSTLRNFLLPIRTNKLVDFLQTCAKQHIVG
jgi:hypothetical protein